MSISIQKLRQERERRSEIARRTWQNRSYVAAKSLLWYSPEFWVKRSTRGFWDKRASSVNIRAKRRFVSGRFLWDLWIGQQHKCYYCGKSLSVAKASQRAMEHEVTIDHVIPNLHEKENLVIACRKCNVLKSDGALEEFRDIVAGIERHQSRIGATRNRSEQVTGEGLGQQIELELS